MRVEPFPFSRGSLAHFSFSGAKNPYSNHQTDVTVFSQGCAPALMTDQVRQGRDGSTFETRDPVGFYNPLGMPRGPGAAAVLEKLIVLKSYKPKQPSLTRSRFLMRAGAITLMPPKVPLNNNAEERQDSQRENKSQAVAQNRRKSQTSLNQRNFVSALFWHTLTFTCQKGKVKQVSNFLTP
ncbi:hypothetical protein DPX16_18866 [Anabarilius grahami]|uniref:Uncharacterized protein n=1 Tax=Anabarilius grahami TaxID=495550 RepID=A0A3N0YMV3_ANAGA|nr:hypothetical protein DPX16_18866 [Anabarilius grahami]